MGGPAVAAPCLQRLTRPMAMAVAVGSKQICGTTQEVMVGRGLLVLSSLGTSTTSPPHGGSSCFKRVSPWQWIPPVWHLSMANTALLRIQTCTCMASGQLPGRQGQGRVLPQELSTGTQSGHPRVACSRVVCSHNIWRAQLGHSENPPSNAPEVLQPNSQAKVRTLTCCQLPVLLPQPVPEHQTEIGAGLTYIPQETLCILQGSVQA
jgi:hypothetical protein